MREILSLYFYYHFQSRKNLQSFHILNEGTPYKCQQELSGKACFKLIGYRYSKAERWEQYGMDGSN